MKNNYLLLLGLWFVSDLSFAASINAGNSKVCMASYTSLSNIVISEAGAVADFGTVGTATTNNRFFINAPVGFSFNPGSGSVLYSGGGNITGSSLLFVNASTVAILYNVDNNTVLKNDVLTISGLQVKAASIAVGSSTATVGTGSTPIVGISIGQTAATWQSAVTAISFSPATPKYTSDASFSLGASQSLASGVSLNSTSYSGSGVTGSSFNPATAGAGVHTLTYTVSTNGPTCSFAATAMIDVNVTPADDVDDDGVTAAVETELGTNPVVATNFATLGLDSDNDGIANALEATLTTNSNLADSDGDGLSDALELIQYITNPLNQDTDGDGMNDDIDVVPGTGECTMPLEGTYKGIKISQAIGE